MSNDTDTNYSAIKFIGSVILFTILFPLAIYVNALTISTLWGWYVVTHFGVAPLPVIVAWGIAVLLKFASMNIADTTILSINEKKSDLGIVRHHYNAILFMSICLSLWTMLMGWIGTFFM
jgi:hypothetical protein